MTPRAAHDVLSSFRPLTPREARTVLDNPGIGWAPGTEDQARAIIAAENARMGGGTIPHSDRVIEDKRQPAAQHYSSDPDEPGKLDGLAVVALIAIGALSSLLLFAGWAFSGPGCPGMDPTWIGWCK